MARKGLNPLKIDGKYIKLKYKPITITTVVYIPMLEGYWAESLNVLKLFFSSLFSSTSIPFDMFVFVNNSCEPVQDYLIELYREKKIQTLIFSEHNLNKLGGMNYLFSIAPGDFVAYADSDVYFLPGWLEKSLEIMGAFPEAGQVTALPTKDTLQIYIDKTHDGIASDNRLGVKTGDDLIPEEYIKAHRASLGKSDVPIKIRGDRKDVLISRNGVSALVSAKDFQFITKKEVIQKVLPLDETTLPEDMRDLVYSPVFEAKVNGLGYWRLSTTDYLIHHMGNHIPDLQGEIGSFVSIDSLKTEATPMNQGGNISHGVWDRILGLQLVRTLLKKIHVWSYKILFER